jgi:hypothetical protein
VKKRNRFTHFATVVVVPNVSEVVREEISSAFLSVDAVVDHRVCVQTALKGVHKKDLDR